MSTQSAVDSSFVTHDGIRLAYRTVGSGAAVVLLHALTATSDVNWEQPGIVNAITSRGWRAVMLDARGHGGSDRPTEPASYGWAVQGQDVIALLDHLGIEQCVLVGYSLGAGTAAWVIPVDPRVRGAVLAGIDLQSIRQWPSEMVEAYIAQLVATSSSGGTELAADATGAFGSSVAASIAIVRALGEPADFRLSDIDVPVIVLNGEDDAPPDEVAREIRGAVPKRVPGDHGTTPLHPEFAAAIVEFLDGLNL